MTETKKARGGNQIIKLALVLFIVSAITSGVLGLVNMFTKDIIKEQEEAKRAAAYQAVLPYDGEYTEVDFDESDPVFENVNSISAAGDTGWVVELSFSGAQSTITAAFGVSSDFTITGTSVIDHAETSGLGAKITETDFTDQFIGQGAGMAVTKDGGTIDAITAATISSRAMANAGNAAIAACEALG